MSFLRSQVRVFHPCFFIMIVNIVSKNGYHCKFQGYFGWRLSGCISDFFFCCKLFGNPKLGFNKIHAAQYFDSLFPHNRECPTELREAVASIIFAAPRCSDVPDLLQIKNLFAAKYGKEFILAASELRPDASVNRAVKCLLLLEFFASGLSVGLAF